MKLFLITLLLLPSLAFAVGTVTITRTVGNYGKRLRQYDEQVTIAWVGDASSGAVPSTNLVLKGYVQKAITVPGATAPTANYAVAFGDPANSALDAFASALTSLSATVTAQKAIVLTGGQTPVFLDGTYVFSLTGNSIASANGTVVLYLTDHP